MIKILFLIHDLGPGGAEKVLVNLVNNLNPEKFDISVIALFGGGVNEKNLKSHIHYRAIYKKMIRGNSKLMKLFSPQYLHKKYIKEKYNLEVSYLEGPSARIISGCKDSETKLISWIHVQQTNRRIAAQSFRSYKEAVGCYQRFDQTVCVSDSVRKDYQNLFPMLQNVQVLYNTNETDQILLATKEPIEQDIFREGEIKLCGVGKIMPIKGFDKLAKIHRRLREEGYPVHTYILGTGYDQEKLERYIEKHQLEDSFTFLGYQSNPYKYVANCDLFVCASVAEGFSTAATEALIVGTPVITTPVAGMKEMLGEHNEYGVIVKQSMKSLYRGIKRLLDDQELLEHYRRQAQVRGKDFSKEKTVEAVEKMFEKLLI
jgi:glycosyltransferase involved in cell wall biosynthesis